MAKRKKLPTGTWVERELFNSEAFWNLRGKAPQLLIRFLGKRKQAPQKDHKGNKKVDWVNLQSLTMTYKELENMFYDPALDEHFGLTQPTITRAIDELLAKGFIEVVNPGGAYQQDKAVYALSKKWTWWKPGMVQSRRKRDVRRGFQG
jgi:hypothetical protein